jgi:hypothetical protein
MYLRKSIVYAILAAILTDIGYYTKEAQTII